MLPFKLTRFQEGVHLVVPPEFANFFIASASAGAALVGLLFVAVSIAPEQMVTRRAPVERQAVAGSAFTALIPHLNLGTLIVPFICLCLVTTLIQAWQLLRLRKGWQSFLRRAFLVVLSLVLYGLELLNALTLSFDPSQVAALYGLILLLVGVFALGLIRAWELLGVQRYGLFGWLNPLRDVNETESFSQAGTSDPASGPPTTDEAAPRSPSQ